MMTIGDIVAQKFVEKNESIDWVRAVRFTILGSCIVVSLLKLMKKSFAKFFYAGANGTNVVCHIRENFWLYNNFKSNITETGLRSIRICPLLSDDHFDFSWTIERFLF